ncbi:hypothetical protein HYZ98_05375 [Candidatus Peregrinibacteria bacterium]|nr:hypothetical protein [Candidatus Peregrinibacteria bacterium]
MIEYIESFLNLGERKEHIKDIRKVATVLRTTVLYMTKSQWERYQKLLERIPKIPLHGKVLQ